MSTHTPEARIIPYHDEAPRPGRMPEGRLAPLLQPHQGSCHGSEILNALTLSRQMYYITIAKEVYSGQNHESFCAKSKGKERYHV